MFLTKNDFIVSRSCPTKLYYKKNHYPSLLEDNPYLDFLRDGGYMVEAIAKLLFSDGRVLPECEDPHQAFRETSTAVQVGDGTLFEATILHGNLLARTDILQREGNVLRLIEVKSSSFDSRENPRPFRGKKGGILSEWRDYLEDLTFQTIVLRGAFPTFTVIPVLCLVDKSRVASEHTTFDKFRLHRDETAHRYRKPTVEYRGDVARLKNSHQLAFLDVTSEVDELTSIVIAAVDTLAASLRVDPIIRIASTIGKNCNGCEYRILENNGQPNGFRECWGRLADINPHILDLYRVDSLGDRQRDAVAQMAAEGKAHLLDVSAAELQGTYAARQQIQIDYTRTNREFVSDDLRPILANHAYPLHFIDFEASRPAVSYRIGMRPYELAAFQWSCETLHEPAGEIHHTEWLNSDDAFPNFYFARALQAQIGDTGTVYIWSPFEITVLREIRRQMPEYGENAPALTAWLDAVTAKANPRIVDLCALAKDHYFHPVMNKSLSIKDTLAAAWTTNLALHSHPAFSKYVKRDDTGQLLTPYAALPPLPIGATEEVVREGTGAMRVYQEMMFGLAKDDSAVRDRYKALLLQYCELDTKAMVFIWMHWCSLRQPES